MDNKIHLIGNAHLDPTWLWKKQEGCAEVLQTFQSAADRLKEYDGFVFTCSSACYYMWVEELKPELFEEIKKYVAEGRWVPVNGWWVQPDCNMPSAESFARQALYSQLYYYEKFGIICKTGYNVDSFGHCAMIPQFVKKSGMDCYVMMRPNKNENGDIPQGLFWWDSPDGSRVLVFHIPDTYAANGIDDINRSLNTIRELSEKNDCSSMLFYGVGNHGGGPTKGDIEYLKSIISKDDSIRFSSPDEYFREVLNRPLDIPAWSEEMQHHASGCYSATSRIKQLNRKAENALTNAEKWNTVSDALGLSAGNTAGFKNAWLNVCYNQFHDILCGCSIREAYDDAFAEMSSATAFAGKARTDALLRITDKIDTWIDGVSDSVSFNERHYCNNPEFPKPVAVFNPLSYPVRTAVRVYHPSRRVTDCDGNDTVFSNVRSSRSNDSHLDTVFYADLPPLGYSVYWLWNLTDSDEVTVNSSDISVNGLTIENRYLKVTFDEKTGGIASIINKADNREHLSRVSFVPQIIDDSATDTWAHNVFKFDKVISDADLDSVKVVERSGVRAVVRVKHRYKNSYISQDYILESESEVIRSKVRILWQEPLTIVKLPVSVQGDNPQAAYEIPGGFIYRKCNGYEEPALTWADVTAGDCGVSVISDAKYSYDCKGNTLRMTAVRNSIFADHYSDRPDADFEYCDEGLQRFEYAVYPHAGNIENSRVQYYADLLNNKPVTVPAGYHKGEFSRRTSFIHIDKDNIRLMAFKKCEDGGAGYIIRLAETAGKSVKVSVVCNIINAGFYADFRPFEIKTFRIDENGYALETDFLEGTVK
ncbi:MAG: alpha-mannosidase [Clostridia bacterium]|nr:alpha-mannosidase [Clostridia bacterium]